MRRQPRRAPRAAVTPKLREHNAAAAGLDIGAEEIWACVPAERDAQPVRVFGTFTPDLHALGGLVGAVSGDDRGDGIDRGVLDSDL